MRSFAETCPVCGANEFAEREVLWPGLINAWQLVTSEVDYINRQQGFYCTQCSNNLRSLALARAITREYDFNGTLREFCERCDLRLLEVNRAGNLTPVLCKMPSHRLVEFPEQDMLDFSLEASSFDVVIHSDTLEHVSNPERALSECRRVLRDKGRCIFTVPIIVDRLSRSRFGLSPSYHGAESESSDDQLVVTEFGLDVWKIVLRAGFSSCEFFALEYPSALVLIAKK
ncbi:class I SAM-dependent methyltransferase [Pseudomonas taiwanensis]|uniref:class I SAM-dependent methyltransferase n=1 Tax=Pseudomonas taiwanensis TaxID=470150 RepID=UPI0015BE7559|nr:class I SAM-dependent methyltransferase [Pseudomonas taiwanensis]